MLVVCWCLVVIRWHGDVMGDARCKHWFWKGQAGRLSEYLRHMWMVELGWPSSKEGLIGEKCESLVVFVAKPEG